MKQQFSSLDIKVLSHELSQTLSGLRMQNIYDLSSRIFLFKFQKPEHREQLIVDPGFRCHLTSFVRTTAAEPSPFVRKLRKLLGTRRVSSVSQLGTDRIIEFQFSDGLYRMFLEFYAAGNIVVTDQEYNVLALLRNVNEGSQADQLRIGTKYDITTVNNVHGPPEITLERLKLGLETAVAKSKQDVVQPTSTTTKSKKKQNVTLRRALAASLNEYPLALVDHALRVSQFDTSLTPTFVLDSDSQLERLLQALEEAKRVVSEITSASTKGYIFAKQRPIPRVKSENDFVKVEKDNEDENLIFEDFQPFKPKQLEEDPKLVSLEIEGFNATVDRYFSSIEGQRLDLRLQERELNAKKKLEDTRRQHQQRLGSLEEAQALNVRKAEAIQANIERVVEVTAAVNGLISQGMDWVDINNLIEVEQSRGNPVAQHVKLPLKLHENTVTLLLGEPETQDDSSETTESRDGSASSDSDDDDLSDRHQRAKSRGLDRKLAIDIDLSLSPWANASQYYDQKKAAADKRERTALASSAALKNAQKKIEADLKKNLSKEKDILRPLRQPFWFEKFYFFLSSDGHLVLAGKDAQQVDLLYSRYFMKGDVFVYADVNGSSAVIIKNSPDTPEAPIPPSTLSQAGVLAVATSTAWDSKAVMAAFWVHFEQVTKVNANGDYLPPGDFHVTGERNFLPPAQLLVGVAIAFEITEESRALHNKHRIQAGTIGTANPQSDSTPGDAADDGRDDRAEKQEEMMPQDDVTDNDSDEDFPDAVPEAKYNSDEEDFPDAALNADSNSDSEEERPATNPLQTFAKGSNEESRVNTDTAKDTLADDTESVADSQTTSLPTRGGHRHISAKERRALKKSGAQFGTDQATTSQTASSQAEETGGVSDSDSDAAMTTTTLNPRSTAPLPRGKRTKLKKAAAKYANQDEDDRNEALQKLGVKAGPERKADEAAARLAREQEEQRQKQRRREQHLLKQAVGKAKEAARHATATGGDGGDNNDKNATEDGDDHAAVDMSITSRIVGKLVPGDQVVSAIAVCAPWPALASYKYKIKMQPGSLKKGKAAREVLSKWQSDAKVPRNLDQRSEDTERIWPREAELIAGLKDTEFIAALPVGKVRIMASGVGAGVGSGKGKNGKGGSARGGRGKKK